MRILRVLLLLVSAALAATNGVAVQANDEPVLAVLEYRGGLLPKRVDIRATRGKTKSPYPNLAQTFWTLREGETIKQDYAPRGRVIRFLRSAGNTPQQVCSVLVRYARSENGWRPTYLLQQQVLSAKAGSTRGTLQVLNRADPNTGGFYRSLSFGFVSGTSQIDSWVVQ